MKKGKMIAGIVWLAVGTLLVLLLFSLGQQLLISGVEAINDMGALLVESSEYEPAPEETQPGDRLPAGYAVGNWRDELEDVPEETPEPEELVSIPVEQTIEELAQEE